MTPKEQVLNADDLLLFDIKSESNISIIESSPEIQLGISNHFFHNLEESNIKIHLNIHLKSKDEKSFADFDLEFFFHIHHLEKYYHMEDEEPLFAGNLVTTLLSVSYSTSRGIIFEKLKNTLWNENILPIISPIKLLNNNND
ncbi:hypothetical protein SDC9_00718 [bioreactor metagenome]|jgi:hypothetical protein|uniref:Preprotein translocase subunit SecB n=1 Tax=bioreactor metagenome TaxID=1076179 RepID=A0A644SKS1_9ZZZZ